MKKGTCKSWVRTLRIKPQENYFFRLLWHWKFKDIYPYSQNKNFQFHCTLIYFLPVQPYYFGAVEYYKVCDKICASSWLIMNEKLLRAVQCTRYGKRLQLKCYNATLYRWSRTVGKLISLWDYVMSLCIELKEGSNTPYNSSMDLTPPPSQHHNLPNRLGRTYSFGAFEKRPNATQWWELVDI